MASIVCIGECMAELAAEGGTGLFRVGFGGDTLNTAVYLARLAPPGHSVAYLTRLGEDPHSLSMRSAWEAEGIVTQFVEMVPGRTVGLYAIAVDSTGERSFTYWRGEAPVRGLFTEGDVEARLDAIRSAKLVYFSGITLAVLPLEGRALLVEAVEAARDAGAVIGFDPNHRVSLWESAEEARAAYDLAYGASTVALVGIEDDETVYGPSAPDRVALRIARAGCPEVVIKAGADPCTVFVNGEESGRVAAEPAAIVDTTAAGDSFNSGYLAVRLGGGDPVDAARAGHALASRVVAHSGAIIPRSEMPEPVFA